MAVNSPLPVRDQLHPVAGLKLGYAHAGIKKLGRKDVLVMRLAPGATVAGVFTTNRFCAAPVQVAKEHLSGTQPIVALVVNTGNANAGTGEAGLANAHATCAALAKQLGCEANQILPFSTGVILEPLPLDKLVAGMPEAIANLNEDRWFDAAEAIMTTDTQPKAASRVVTIAGKRVTMTGISKGAGMIKPNMATMLGYLAMDARIAQPVLDHLVKRTADKSFNCITIDGDTSTNDSFMLIATGAGSLEINDVDTPEYAELETAVIALAQKQPGKINYASSGNGGAQHLFQAMFVSMANINMVHIPYKGSSQVRSDLLGGQIAISCVGIASIINNHKAGQVRIIGVTSAKRSPELPDVPSIGETVPGYEFSAWTGLYVPAKTPPAVVAKLSKAISDFLKIDSVQKYFGEQFITASYKDPAEFSDYVKTELVKWDKVVKDANIKVQQ